MYESLKKELIKYGKIAGERNLTPGISGNISTRYKNSIIITSSGSASGFLADEDLSLINFNAEVMEGNSKPSSESLLHINFYKKRPDINAIFHVHSPYLTAFATAGMSLDDGISPEIIYCFDKIPLAKYALPGTNNLAENTSIFFDKYDVVLMENHGVVVGGKNVKDAYLRLELVENYAKTIICAKILGGAKILSEEEILKIKALK